MKINKRDFYLHSIMCIIGGFMGAYALLGRAHTLGSAQTSNLALLVLSFLGKDYHDFLLHIVGMLLYVTGISICIWMSEKTKVNMQRYSILIDIIGMVVLCVIPSDTNSVVCLLPIFFMMSTQWTVFHGVGKYNSSTIFSTNNLKQMTLSFEEYLIRSPRDPEELRRAKFFANSLLWYHIGVAFSFVSFQYLGVLATLCCLPVAFTAYLLAGRKGRTPQPL